MSIHIKRVYEPPGKEDGIRILVDRLWPRGLKKEKARVDGWWKDLAPSDSLRKWFDHDPNKWPEFKRRYFKELDNNEKEMKERIGEIKNQPLTFLYGTREEIYNNAAALKEYVEKRLEKEGY